MTDIVAEIENALPYFTGTGEWHRWNPMFKNYLLTDGAKYLAEKANAFWLMDTIASYYTEDHVKAEEFQVWKLEVKTEIDTSFISLPGSTKRTAVLTCEDGNGHVVVTQEIGYTDFPLDEIKLWCIASGDHRIILLPSEY